MARSELIPLILGVILCICLDFTAATLCKPFSKFKLDCNTCNCSSSGMEFSCTKEICWPLVYRDKYLIEENEQGYKILKPKDNSGVDNGKRLNNNNDLFPADRLVKDNQNIRGQRNIESEYYRQQPIAESPYLRRYISALSEKDKYNQKQGRLDQDYIVNSESDKRNQRYIFPNQEPPKYKLQNLIDDYDADDQSDQYQYPDEAEYSSDEYYNDDYYQYSEEDEDDDDDDTVSSWGRIPQTRKSRKPRKPRRLL